MGVEPLVDFLPGSLGECGLHPAHNLVHHIGVDVLKVILRKTVRHRVLINPALVFSLWGRTGDSPRFTGKRAGFPARRHRQKQKSSPPHGGLLRLGTLNGWGARYPEKKARREKSYFDILISSLCGGSRILRAWVADCSGGLGFADFVWSWRFRVLQTPSFERSRTQPNSSWLILRAISIPSQ